MTKTSEEHAQRTSVVEELLEVFRRRYKNYHLGAMGFIISLFSEA